MGSKRSVLFYVNGNACCDEEIWHPNTFAGLWEKEVRLAGLDDCCGK